jgi:pimeloyl-ACP methyl ester carboxylesterase
MASASEPESGATVTSFREITCTEGDATLYGYWRDAGSRRNLVLIPGSGCHHSIWEPVVATGGIEANVLLVELPGFGKSTPRMPDGCIESFAALALRLVDAAGIGRFVAGGHSLGGMMAIEMLAQAAGRLEGVVACEGWTHAAVEQEAFGGLKDETLTPDQAARRDRYTALARAGWPDPELRRFARIWTRWEAGLALLEDAAVPVLEIWGDRGLTPRPGLDRLRIPARPNIALRWIAQGAHYLPVQEPERVGRQIADFVNGSAGRP